MGIYHRRVRRQGSSALAYRLATSPELGLVGAFTSTFSNDPKGSAPLKCRLPLSLSARRDFYDFSFLPLAFYGAEKLRVTGEKIFPRERGLFFAVASALLAAIVWFALKINPMMAFGARYRLHRFLYHPRLKQNAEQKEKELMSAGFSDTAKIFYLEVIDATFSIEGVLGAFAFTLSVPLILLGNGLGAFVVRKLTIGNIDKIKNTYILKTAQCIRYYFWEQ